MVTRTDRLALPKPNLLRFPDRRSVYWLDDLPTRSKNISTTAFELTPRLEQLAQSKQSSRFFQESRRSPEWMVSAAALKACPSQRVCILASPRVPVDGWQLERPLLAPSQEKPGYPSIVFCLKRSQLSVAVKPAEPSPRICHLAQPKLAKMLTRAPSVDSSTHAFGVPTPPSSRILQLASPKQVHAQHALARPVSGPLPDRVLKAVASESLQTLARPKTRQALFEGYDPYRVSPAARAATASPRLMELSLPLPRKCKSQ